MAEAAGGEVERRPRRVEEPVEPDEERGEQRAVRATDVDGLEKTIRRLSGTKGVSRTRTTIVLSTKWENRVGELPEEQ